jgi:hypothetical protein
VDEFVQRAPPGRQDAVRTLACRLGREIGYEWARDNRVRRISTRDLRTFEHELDAASDVESGLQSVEREALAKGLP